MKRVKRAALMNVLGNTDQYFLSLCFCSVRLHPDRLLELFSTSSLTGFIISLSVAMSCLLSTPAMKTLREHTVWKLHLYVGLQLGVVCFYSSVLCIRFFWWLWAPSDALDVNDEVLYLFFNLCACDYPNLRFLQLVSSGGLLWTCVASEKDACWYCLEVFWVSLKAGWVTSFVRSDVNTVQF